MSQGFAAVVRQAVGVWFSGGDHRRLLRLYAGAELEAELLGVVERGGVVGGSSAGAMVMGTYQAERTGKKGGAITDRKENRMASGCWGYSD